MQTATPPAGNVRSETGGAICVPHGTDRGRGAATTAAPLADDNVAADGGAMAFAAGAPAAVHTVTAVVPTRNQRLQLQTAAAPTSNDLANGGSVVDIAEESAGDVCGATEVPIHITQRLDVQQHKWHGVRVS